MANLTGYIGGMRQGKTILAVRDTFKDYLKALKCRTNINLDFPEQKGLPKPKHFSLMQLVKFCDAPEKQWQNVSILWDEIYLNLECRLSASSELNRIASYFIFQSGKRRVKVRWTSQMFGNPDNRLRWATIEIGEIVKAKGMFLHCERFSKTINAKWCWENDCPYSKWCIKNKNYTIYYSKWNGATWKKYKLPHMEKYIGLYDTAQVVDFYETQKVNWYLQVQRRAYKKKMRKAIEEKLNSETRKEFAKEIDEALF